ncbi:MAG: hypothetical protein UX85_C0002G0049 [Candidatus Beckwithbacteria bacterium GW2011_GWB1_47_15]|uniref:Esterase n=1 Tax=Candidatus Beckwithbacteria bacterium GW2011_GWB1_47_15 TaxID=1618371 RepID=A0A0G1RWJ0_9BACT|nr:MAG: esterase [Candidatus Beckwithbacteria bacterium GW2011_GWC1_49_16]KKU35615.1 MAG: hypothetical protein UX50_C0002G0042 [Candidatus Beckwithbacteria bacterium GW2011_GWA1_46_30]KKU61669.1 MAG: hypothetical protein UX85_C0002G0049 [Candidatus Beckwithbacteria bacterium GW2011_GWB1_47_15]KKU72172.1 MAG: hypothetical protein UX97_C0001G0042 [Candidatus Beckwithbacteria bacterium GW2011_GWA2_47_25]KKW04797.1 MAG: hypothetical protein UY37_C0002G0050 [Candidatus Beckwithbacteria bacterium GW2
MKVNKVKIIQIHGNGGGSGKDNWHPYVHRELKKLKLKVLTPDFPDPVLAREKYWLPFLREELKADKNTILIGHSSGAIAAMRFTEKNQLLGSILVASYYTDLGDKEEKASGYFDRPWQWDKIRKNQKWIVQFASIDDPYFPIKEPLFIHQKLNSEYHQYLDKGHFGADKKKKKFPEIVAVIKNKLDL